MTNDEKIQLIQNIHDIFYHSTDDYNWATADFLAILYPSIVIGDTCCLCGSSSEVRGLYIFLKQNFASDDPLWDYIELQEEEQFTIKAKHYTRWLISESYMDLESDCLYDIINNLCHSIKTVHKVKNAELIEEWVEFETPHSNFFQDTIIRVDASNGLQIEEQGN
jgi:hypothetical protein